MIVRTVRSVLTPLERSLLVVVGRSEILAGEDDDWGGAGLARSGSPEV